MASMINPKWAEKVRNLLDAGQPIDETIEYAPAAKWLVVRLSSRNRMFRMYNLGAGVKRITTDTDQCPCCKRKIE